MAEQTQSQPAPPVPRWSLDRIYSGFDSRNYRSDIERLTADLEALLQAIGDQATQEQDPKLWLERCIGLFNGVSDRHENLDAYAYARYSTDTSDPEATRELDRIRQLALPMHRAQVLFRDRLAELTALLPDLQSRSAVIAAHGFFLREQLRERHYQMSAQEEELAADLARCGADAWSRLQESVGSQLTVSWETGKTRTVIELRALAHDPERAVRQRAFELEIEAWRSVEVPLAFALNGVKGHSVVINRRRGYRTPLQRALFQSRISDAAFEAMISVMEQSLPLFRGYLKTKARALGLGRLAFYDLFAPVGHDTGRWSFAEAAAFIVQQFEGFAPDLARFAARAIESGWIDAEPRAGKIGGAYCISMPLAGESRILANFDGSFSSVFTLAHELGHAYHHHLLRDETALRRDYPMTLAETASIFCETVVLDRALSSCPAGDRITLLELFLQDATQVIVDILSRFYFERELFARREQTELSAADLCRMMTESQKATYGDGLDPRSLHPYMWAVKGHYYRHDLSFYNYPYAFGLLFGLALYAQYRRSPQSFPATYRSILTTAGHASAVEVTALAGFAIETAGFWQAAIDLIADRAAEFDRAVEQRP